MRFTVRGKLVSLKNSRDIHRNGLAVKDPGPGATREQVLSAVATASKGRLFPKKNKDILQFQHDFLAQCRKFREPHFTGNVCVVVNVYYPSRRHDLDCALIYDLLQHESCQVIKNDRQVKTKIEYWHLDRENPRVVVDVYPSMRMDL